MKRKNVILIIDFLPWMEKEKEKGDRFFVDSMRVNVCFAFGSCAAVRI